MFKWPHPWPHHDREKLLSMAGSTELRTVRTTNSENSEFLKIVEQGEQCEQVRTLFGGAWFMVYFLSAGTLSLNRLCTVFEPFLNRFWTGDHLRLNPSLTLKNPLRRLLCTTKSKFKSLKVQVLILAWIQDGLDRYFLFNDPVCYEPQVTTRHINRKLDIKLTFLGLS